MTSPLSMRQEIVNALPESPVSSHTFFGSRTPSRGIPDFETKSRNPDSRMPYVGQIKVAGQIVQIYKILSRQQNCYL